MTVENDGLKNWRPNKGTLVWAFAGGIVLTLIVGFAIFDWRTAGSAQEMAEDAATEAQAQLASAICVERFIASPSAVAKLADLKEMDSWDRDDFIADGGWVTFDRIEGGVPGAADLCANSLSDMDATALRAPDNSQG